MSGAVHRLQHLPDELVGVLTPDTDLGIPETGLGLSFPDPLHPAAGCPFHPRCPQRMAVCDTVRPALDSAAAGEVACHLYPLATPEGAMQ